jgi:hypothetical protein
VNHVLKEHVPNWRHQGVIMAMSLPSIQGSAFSASCSLNGPLLVLHLEGTADTEIATPLAAYLRAVHTATQLLHVPEVVVDFHDLYFMTAACLKCFLSWISAIEELEERARYAVRLEANPDLRWQARSFGALRAVATTIVTLHA